jgi:hypothetical protein
MVLAKQLSHQKSVLRFNDEIIFPCYRSYPHGYLATQSTRPDPKHEARRHYWQ